MESKFKIEDAIHILKSNNAEYLSNFKKTSAETKNYVYEWISKEYDSSDWVKEVLDSYNYSPSTQEAFESWWTELFESTKNKNSIYEIFTSKVYRDDDLYEFGKNEFGSASPDIINRINLLLTILIILLSFNKKVINTERLQEIISKTGVDSYIELDKLYEEFGDQEESTVEELAEEDDRGVSTLSTAKKPSNPKVDFQAQATMPFVAYDVANKDYIEGRAYLIQCFNKFIKDSFINMRKTKQYGYSIIPEKNDRALVALFGRQEAKKFDSFTVDDEIPVDFSTFWNSIEKKFRGPFWNRNKNFDTIMKYLQTELKVKPSEGTSEEYNVSKYIFDSLIASQDEVASKFASSYNYDNSNFSVWWNKLSERLTVVELKEKAKLNRYIKKINEYSKIFMSADFIYNPQFKQLWSDVWYFMQMLNTLDLDSTSSSTTDDTEVSDRFNRLELDTSEKTSKINVNKLYKISKSNFKFITNENLVYSFDNKNLKIAQDASEVSTSTNESTDTEQKDQSPSTITLKDLGNDTKNLEVDAKMLKRLIEYLFTSIKLNIYEQLQKEDRGRMTAQYYKEI